MKNFLFILLLFLILFFPGCRLNVLMPRYEQRVAIRDSIARADSIAFADSMAWVSSIARTESIASRYFLESKKNAVFTDSLVFNSIQTHLQGLSAFEEKSFSVIGVGDIMLGTNYPNTSYLPAHDGKHLLAPVADVLRNATVTFGNLEGVLLDEGGEVKDCNNPDLCFAFRMPEHYARHLKNAGFDMLSLANNHVGDFGEEGRLSTVRTLDELGIAHAGLLTHPYSVIERDGIRFGLLAFSPNRGTLSIHNYLQAQSLVRQLKQNTDIVIVSFHGGGEGEDAHRVTCETEFYYGENRGNVCEFSRAVIDAGADIVFGHGPHVTRAVDLYKDRFIAYSLGNFCTYARFRLTGERGIAPIIKVFVDHTGKFIRAEITPIRQTGRGGPFIDPNNRAVHSLQRVTKDDFPDSPLTIGNDGLIERK